ncbi:hypothetical protein ACSLVN_27720, partial [Klebsiella pneumoniae]|uniref:hypothetical protein n=1 Tax=Klebsiella pneumoniae TaxID=573 RepID=UPI003EE1A195
NQYYIPDDRYLRPLLRSKKAADKPIRVEVFSNMFDRDSGIESVFDMANMEMVSHWQNVAMREDNGGGQTNHMNFRIAGLLDHWAM